MNKTQMLKAVQDSFELKALNWADEIEEWEIDHLDEYDRLGRIRHIQGGHMSTHLWGEVTIPNLGLGAKYALEVSTPSEEGIIVTWEQRGTRKTIWLDMSQVSKVNRF